MKRTIRISCFETNSSSLHTVVVARGNRHIPAVLKDQVVVVKGGEFGWEVETYRDPLDKLGYIYTGLLYFIENDLDIFEDKDLPKKLLERIKEVLASEGVKVEWSKSEDSYYPNGYIDHCANGVQDLVEFLNESDDNILDFIFDDNSLVATGNDNSEDDYPYYLIPNVDIILKLIKNN